MATFGPDFLQELRDRLRLSDYVARRVQLRRNGSESSGLCPFHNEKTPSFTVSDDKGFYHCFGCGAHGSVIDWVMETEGLGFPEAVRRLAADANLAVPEDRPEDKAAAARRQSLHDVLETACTWFQAQLAAPDATNARAYLAGRGLDAEAIAAFRLGFAPDGRGRLKAALAKTGIGDDQLVAAGLMKRPDDGGPLRDYFFDRITFPIADERGRIVGFGGRALGDSPAKYLNSPDTEVFHKGQLLYNLQRARAAARGAGTVIAVEGYMDVIALHRAGYPHAVAPLGTAMTERQLELMWRMADEPVLCFDGDAAGRRAAARAAERALPHLKPAKSLRFVALPPGEDPDSLLRTAGAAGLARALGRTAPLLALVWGGALAGRRIDTPEQRAAVQAELGRRAARIADPAVRQHYDRMLRDRFYTLLRAPRRGIGRPRQPAAAPRPAAIARPDRDQRLADQRSRPVRAALAALINHPEIGEAVYEPLSGLPIADAELARLRDAIVAWLGQDHGVESGAGGESRIDRSALENHLRRCGFDRTVDSLTGRTTRVPDRFAWREATAEEAVRGWYACLRDLEAKSEESTLDQARSDFRRDFDQRSMLRLDAVAQAVRRGRAAGSSDQDAGPIHTSGKQ
ncbi:MAG: DNA primase [Alphaproteobacteria bacterium]